jgi:hypothetical protein
MPRNNYLGFDPADPSDVWAGRRDREGVGASFQLLEAALQAGAAGPNWSTSACPPTPAPTQGQEQVMAPTGGQLVLVTASQPFSRATQADGQNRDTKAIRDDD